MLSVCAQCALIPSGTPERVWAIGDLHGDVGCALHWVERTGLLRNASLPAAEWEWTEPSSQLVFLGDYIDRGPDSKAVLTLVRELTLRFPEHVHALLGNHELNLLLDRARSPSGGRYLEYAYAAAHPAQYEAWLPEGVQMVPDGPSSIVEFVRPKAARPRVADALRRWQRAYMRGAAALAQSDLVAFASEMVEYRGLHGSYAGRYADRHSRRGRRRAAPPEQVACDRVAAVLRRLNVSRIAVGHTPEDSVREPRICAPRREACEGQIVRLERRDARAAWVLHVVESEPDIERDEGAVEDMKLELR
ncbi:hypothetical protein EMIHUDRAFT_199870 [Emiliania huxleyi CCMP1516]|uniref:Calcineurin-like phosphoesterase domain-containing protein n=2 Tax=Emiliania huxleyi TaxID=2903 RepID=A0A0D3KUJ0_EMIH1|nr:hypothetical protein EMIHUDRAFT_199870 [Emiliania huxleyi CCMP1516]EOD39425.1 hypothetical protein EMIHUDRAFT_199870 [Emiliania huxleyi CCMP1516]|eukprot:XP_005791854.1 hypothetical protein EMIHUDRAFT_199870 [Emiliania huxleyi CCMP1516]